MGKQSIAMEWQVAPQRVLWAVEGDKAGGVLGRIQAQSCNAYPRATVASSWCPVALEQRKSICPAYTILGLPSMHGEEPCAT